MQKSMGNATLISAACFALMPIAPAYAANWVYVATNTNKADWYYDSDTIRRFGNQITVWVKIDHSRNKTVKYRETLVRYRYDCADRTSTALQLTDYYPDGKNETFIWETYEQEEQAVAPETVIEGVLEAVCR